MTPDFKPFNKISRLTREIVITEKIDGTNACICITEDGEFLTGSRTRWITPQNDNAGFSRWAHDNKDELMKLGVGFHFGEWWGQGIQRGYGITGKKFSLFNVHLWGDALTRPICCDVVPVLARGMFDTNLINETLKTLEIGGSVASAGFMNPEGIVVFHTASGNLFKKTIKNDKSPKGLL